jgi:hypothetical protein
MRLFSALNVARSVPISDYAVGSIRMAMKRITALRHLLNKKVPVLAL